MIQGIYQLQYVHKIEYGSLNYGLQAKCGLWHSPWTKKGIHIFIFIFLSLFIYLFLTDSAYAGGQRDIEKEGDRESQVGYTLSVRNLTWGSNS